MPGRDVPDAGSPRLAQVTLAPPRPRVVELTYSVPRHMASSLRQGMRVIVPLGSRLATGIVTGLPTRYDGPRLRPIADLLDPVPAVPPQLLEVCRRAAKYYLVSLGEMLAAALPGAGAESLRLVRPARDAPPPGTLPARAAALLDYVRGRGPTSTRALRRRFGPGTSHLVGRLAAAGAVTVSEHVARRGRLPGELERAPPAGRAAATALGEGPALTEAQSRSVEEIVAALRSGRPEVFLLHGVTASGKTEVYLRAAAAALSHGSVIFLTPEIGLTPQLADRIERRFREPVALLHSDMAPGARWRAWWEISRAVRRLVVGARSAVFAPAPDLALIVIDEEHDSAYKQEDGVRYNARDVALMRGETSRCPVVLGSATPSIESVARARQSRYRLLSLTDRIGTRPLPAVQLVDLRKRPRSRDPGPVIFSPDLQEAIGENAAAGGQTLLFLNRRGFAPHLQCCACGFVPGCPACSVSLTYHRRSRALRCHHCDHASPAPGTCPRCQSPEIQPAGVGTEQVEAEVRARWPEARVARMDRDTISRRGAHRHLLDAWRGGDIDILIGTQMITKGHDVPNVTLVGVICADVGLHMPDFRAAERTFQLLTQVAGRAGRGDRPGRVLIQTYQPDHYSLRAAAAQDFDAFASEELAFRAALGYPPFLRLVGIRFEGIDARAVEADATAAARALRSAQGTCQVLGPAPAPIERRRGYYRWQILIKGADPDHLGSLTSMVRDLRPRAGIRRLVDIDPMNML